MGAIRCFLIPTNGRAQPRSAENPLAAKLLHLHEKVLRVETESRKARDSDDKDHRAGAALAEKKNEPMSLVDFLLAKQLIIHKGVMAATNVEFGPRGILATLKAASAGLSTAKKAQLEVDYEGMINKLVVIGFEITTEHDEVDNIHLVTLQSEIESPATEHRAVVAFCCTRT